VWHVMDYHQSVQCAARAGLACPGRALTVCCDCVRTRKV
jgi:hypothetical protein